MKKVKLILFGLIVLSVTFLPCISGAKQKVKIAFLGPLTGPVASFGVGARNSFDLAIREANQHQSLPFELVSVIYDDEGNPATGVAAANKVVSDLDIAAAVGHFNSPVALATIHIFHRAGVPIVLWGTVDPSITKKYNYPEVTRVTQALDIQTVVASEFAINQGYKRWSIIHDASDFGKKAKADFSRILTSQGGEIISVDSIQPGEKDFMPILTKIKKANPQAIFAGVVVMEGAMIKLQMKKLGMDKFFMGISGIEDPKFNEIAGAAAEGTVTMRPGVILDELPKGKKFLSSYKEAGYKDPPGPVGDTTYDATNIVIDALKKVGPDKAKLIKAIRNTEYNGIRGNITFDEVGQTTQRSVKVMVSQDGKWVLWDKSEYGKGKRKLPGK